MEKITSRQNSRVKELIKLQSKKYRRQKQQFLLEGFTLIEAALQAGAEIEEIYIDSSLDVEDEIEKLKNLTSDRVLFINLASDLMEEVTTTVNPQGIVAVARRRTAELEEILQYDKPLLLLSQVQDPGNAGTLLRSASAAGIEGIIALKGTVELFNPKVIRSSMGGIFKPVITTDVETDEFIKKTLEVAEERRLILTAPEAEMNYFDVDYQENDIFVVGNENKGIPGKLRSINHIPVKIPLPGDLQSLNAAVAGSIVIFDSIRQNFS